MRSQCNAGVSKKLDPELPSAVVAVAGWCGIQKKQMDGNCLCVQIQIRQ